MHPINTSGIHQSVASWLEYFEQRHSDAPIQLGLSRIKRVAQRLNLLKWTQPVITVAGTNGKGSTVASLKSLYQHSGYAVATYTSPHIMRFNERIQIGDQLITDEALILIFQQIESIPESKQLTYFEVATLAALMHFKHQQPDIIILEVGMGGRLDATNIIDATLAIITTIDFDHQTFLGNTLDEIGFEKAGILRPNQIALYADHSPPKRIIQYAEQLNVRLYEYTDYKHEFDLSQFTQSIHAKAMAAALKATTLLHVLLPVDTNAYLLNPPNIALLGRQQWLNTAIPTLVDVAHNLQAVAYLRRYILDHVQCSGTIRVVFGCLQDKPVDKIINLLNDCVDEWYISKLDDARTASEAVLKDAVSVAITSKKAYYFEDALLAYNAANCVSSLDDVIIVFGSFVLVSTVLGATSFNKGLNT